MPRKKLAKRQRMARKTRFTATPGFHNGLSETIYRSCEEYLSNSYIGNLHKGSIYRKETDSKEFGTAVHAACEYFVNNPDNILDYPKPELTPANKAKFLSCMDSFLRFYKSVNWPKSPAQTELAVFADWGRLGLDKYIIMIQQHHSMALGLKAKFDLYFPKGLVAEGPQGAPSIKESRPTIVDVKTTTTDSIHDLKFDAIKYNWDRQRYLYKKVAKAITGEDHVFYFLVLFKQPKPVNKYLIVGEAEDADKVTMEKYLSYGFYDDNGFFTI